jgi:hypothetical protein
MHFGFQCRSLEIEIFLVCVQKRESGTGSGFGKGGDSFPYFFRDTFAAFFLFLFGPAKKRSVVGEVYTIKPGVGISF